MKGSLVEQTAGPDGQVRAEAAATATRLRVQAGREALDERTRSAAAYSAHPALLRLEELAALRELAKNAKARLFLDFPDGRKAGPEA
ncbi:MAG: hypothetical protein U0871_22445 [Gemmataceae bacterium]